MPPRGRGRGRGAASTGPARPTAPADQPAVAPTVEIASSTDVSRSSTPNAAESSTRGAKRGSTRAKRTPFTPTFTGRRSKAEREALEKAGKERDAIRLKELKRESDAISREKRLDPTNRRGGQKNQGRGGYTGVSIGPFSLGSATQDRRKGAASFNSGSRATRVKREPGEFSGGSRGSAANAGDDHYASSDNDEEADFPRKNIDLIEISSDEEEPGSTERTERPSRSHAATTLPVRIGRKEHQERVFGINTEASSAGPKNPEDGESSGAAIKTEGGEGTSRKGKGKAKEVEITGERATYKGMWGDAEKSQVQVKSEPMSDEEDGAVPFGLSQAPSQPADNQPPSSPETKKKLKIRRKVMAQPALQTEEDKQEWARFLINRQAMRTELGSDAKEPAKDTTGDIKMADTDDAANQTKQSVRDNNVYIFQLPPTIPDLRIPGIKEEPPESKEPEPTPLQPVPTSSTSKTPIKVEESLAKKAPVVYGPHVASGLAGKIRVRESGRTTLVWGGTNFELNPGHQATFLQEVASVNIVPASERVVPEDGGDASSFGRVKGKFVVVPDWLAML